MMKKERQFELKNKWLDFVYTSGIIAVGTTLLLYVIHYFELVGESRWIFSVITINLASIAATSLLVISFVHYRDQKNFVKITTDSIEVAKRSLLPDTVLVKFDNIIYENRYTENGYDVYSIVYNGGAVIIKQSDLRFKTDWKQLVYELKEVIH